MQDLITQVLIAAFLATIGGCGVIALINDALYKCVPRDACLIEVFIGNTVAICILAIVFGMMR